MEKNMTRRQIIKAAPALAAIPTVALASQPEDQTFALIEAHRAAERAFNAACDASDLVTLGRLATDDERRTALAAGLLMDDAAIALCEYAPPTLVGSKAKVEAILGSYLVESREEIEGPIGALVRSIAQMVRA